MDGNEPWEDLYGILQLNPNADDETIHRVFRLLAKRYHPDNLETGDTDRFNRMKRAYEVLSHAESRAGYDARYFANRSTQWKMFNDGDNGHADKRMFQAILSLLYIARRQNVRHPGLGIIEIEQMLALPAEHLDFHIWYLREKQWIERMDNGQLAITVLGVEKVSEGDLSLRTDRLLAEQSHQSASEPDNSESRLIREVS